MGLTHRNRYPCLGLSIKQDLNRAFTHAGDGIDQLEFELEAGTAHRHSGAGDVSLVVRSEKPQCAAAHCPCNCQRVLPSFSFLFYFEEPDCGRPHGRAARRICWGSSLTLLCRMVAETANQHVLLTNR